MTSYQYRDLVPGISLTNEWHPNIIAWAVSQGATNISNFRLDGDGFQAQLLGREHGTWVTLPNLALPSLAEIVAAKHVDFQDFWCADMCHDSRDQFDEHSVEGAWLEARPDWLCWVMGWVGLGGLHVGTRDLAGFELVARTLPPDNHDILRLAQIMIDSVNAYYRWGLIEDWGMTCEPGFADLIRETYPLDLLLTAYLTAKRPPL